MPKSSHDSVADSSEERLALQVERQKARKKPHAKSAKAKAVKAVDDKVADDKAADAEANGAAAKSVSPKSAKARGAKAKGAKAKGAKAKAARRTYNYGDTVAEKQEVLTPVGLYKMLDDEFHFDFDPCPYPRPPWDGLSVPWKRCNYVNPPYSAIKPWLQKAVDECEQNGAVSVFLVPARTSSRYWKPLVYDRANEVRFIYSRVTFEGTVCDYSAPAPFPLAIIVYLPNYRMFRQPPPPTCHIPDGLRLDNLCNATREQKERMPEAAILCALLHHSQSKCDDTIDPVAVARWASVRMSLNGLLCGTAASPQHLHTVMIPLYYQMRRFECEVQRGGVPPLAETIDADTEMPLIHLLYHCKAVLDERAVRRAFKKLSRLPSCTYSHVEIAGELLTADWYADARAFCQAYIDTAIVEQRKAWRCSYAATNETGEFEMQVIYF